MKRIHIALAVRSISASVDDYTRRFDAPPTVVVDGKYAMWRTDQMNFSINEIPARAGQLRHLGFEDDEANGFEMERDCNDIVWEHFSPDAQDAKIIEMYGSPTERG